MSATLAVGPCAFAASATAAVLWEFEGIRSARLRLVVPRSRRPGRRPGIIVGQSRTLRPGDVTTFRNIPITTPSRTLMDVSTEIDACALEDVLDSAIRRKRVVVDRLLDEVRSRRTPGVRGLAVLEQLLIVRVGRAPSGSSKENRLKRLIETTGLPIPVAQYTVRRPDGSFVARVDFAYPAAKVVLEFDSYEHHSSRNDWEADLVRQNALVDLGWLPLRITDRQLDNVPDDVLRIIWRRLAAAGAVNARQIGRSV